MAPPRSRPISAGVLFFFLAAASAALIITAPSAAVASAAPDDETTTCVPSLQRLLSCLDFIEHRSDEIPEPCCVQVRATVAEQPCCLMHVVRGNAARLIGPGYDNARAMVNVTADCLDDAAVLVSITRNCSGKPLPPLTPEFRFTTAAAVPPPPPPLSSGATRGASYTSLLVALLASVVYGAVAILQKN